MNYYKSDINENIIIQERAFIRLLRATVYTVTKMENIPAVSKYEVILKGITITEHTKETVHSPLRRDILL